MVRSQLLVEFIAVFLLLGAFCACGAAVVAQLAPWFRPVRCVYGSFICSVCGAFVECACAWLEQLSLKPAQSPSVAPAAENADEEDDYDAGRGGGRRSAADSEAPQAPSPGPFLQRSRGPSFCRVSTADDSDDDWDVEPHGTHSRALVQEDPSALPCNALTLVVSGDGDVRAALGSGFDMHEPRRPRRAHDGAVTFGGRSNDKYGVRAKHTDLNAAWRAQKLAVEEPDKLATAAACTFGGGRKPKRVGRSRPADPADLS